MMRIERTDPQNRLVNEREHFNAVVRQTSSIPLVMPHSNIERYRKPQANTAYPLEYVFHLAGNLRGRSVVEVGSGNGLNSVLLATLGATVTAVDISDESLRLARVRARANSVEQYIHFVNGDAANLGLRDCSADLIFCVEVLHHVEVLPAAREIYRVLKPSGRAIFMEPVTGNRWWEALKPLLPRAPEISADEKPLSEKEIRDVIHTVGTPGPARIFGLTYRMVKRSGCRNRKIVHVSHVADRELLHRLLFLRGLASPLVWCADEPGR